jgi:hypothetical protein
MVATKPFGTTAKLVKRISPVSKSATPAVSVAVVNSVDVAMDSIQQNPASLLTLSTLSKTRQLHAL